MTDAAPGVRETVNREALASLYQAHGHHVFRRSLRLLGNEAEAWDVCHDVFAKLMETYDDLDRIDHPTAWLYRCTSNACIDRLRLRKPQDAAALDSLVQDARVEERTSAQRLVRELFERLEPAEVELAVLRFVDGCTMEELEQICGATRKTLAKRLQVIRARAADLLGGDPDSEGGTP